MEDITYETIVSRKKNRKYIFILIALILSCFIGYLLYFLFSKKIQIPVNYKDPYLPPPRKFMVNSSYLLPAWNQFDRGTCWAFSSIYLLESQYKHNGIMKGFLNDTEYVGFSQDALAKWMVDKCKKYTKAVPCLSGLRRRGHADGGSIEEFITFYEYFDDFKTSVLPISACPYNELPKDEMKCPKYDKAMASNPIKFKLSGGELGIGIDRIKDLLYKYRYPLSFSFPMPVSRYYFECDQNPIIKNTSICTEHLLECPHDNTKYCSFLDYQISKPNTAEMITHYTDNLVYGVGHAMVLVGYNDDLEEPLMLNITRRKPTKGAFILRNSWGSRGHSIEYLYGLISHEQEQMICPNPDDVSKWTPVTKSCLEKTGDGTKCSTDITRHLGGRTFTGGSLLKCINKTHCSEGEYYYLLRNGNSKSPVIKFLDSGVPCVYIINARTQEVKLVDTIPIEHLYYAMRLVDPPSNSENHCGYVGYSYNSISTIEQGLSVRTPTWRVFQVKADFEDSSYDKSGASGDYSFVRSSTKSHSIFKPSDPLEDIGL
ncbi:hypothetical protein TVAG_038560 [Trichomonas vaginalis G3]|uniref:Uncharacterized protein n=1 Tax=Trichomonas vaginalis (strain ATCC PRA-98 / G3) TaxID=412133 RepID=A2DY12_TRIV3|nr:papain family cysteine protease domain containing protein family [Trichomonas vaginalis G3]EAY14748.1 hypothetical protein TVAG_038560 [Trichomonas vaginalis G3]KAI5487881.1 papain family cysteine protease domain containing protein family [Trichomonas vaginalis G3]|eukprot:XP_001326971.1 hypothetical protein [Trichomonas vaginalis G3]